MSPDHPRTARASDILGRPVADVSGRSLGRVADLETVRDPDGRHRVVAAIVAGGRWGRLLGYEGAERTGPWLLERLARWVLRRSVIRVPWRDLHPGDGAPPGFVAGTDLW
ncbi:PRC-barrel domain-containing protein [Nucisporomicrobium flavum]|uniref:PRC-barrel domain-containing protein n=1 Tax=Nucisporomicrobium flavum TaxID=2785915 RepID=UPI0018F3758E|nr:PRC-barrel domain-containing protein [Nucisporomicrobium flavum]